MDTPGRPTSPDEAWRALFLGNERFVSGQPLHPNQDAAHRARHLHRQAPFAVIFGCSDSRVAAEIVFDQGLGDLFVVRTAGHMIDVSVLASVEFAISELAAPLVVVLGHDQCGAVKATLDLYDSTSQTPAVPPGHIRSIVEHLGPDVLQARAQDLTDVDAISRLRTTCTCEQFIDRSAILRDQIAQGRCALVAASYQLNDGTVKLLSSTGLSSPMT